MYGTVVSETVVLSAPIFDMHFSVYNINLIFACIVIYHWMQKLYFAFHSPLFCIFSSKSKNKEISGCEPNLFTSSWCLTISGLYLINKFAKSADVK